MARTLLVLASLLVLIAAALLAPSPLPPTQGMLRSRLAAALASSSRSRPTISLVRPFSISSAAMAIDLPPFPSTRRDEDKVLVFQSKKDGRVEIKDPYHWLEQPPSESKETEAFVDAQAAFCQAQLETVPGRAAFREALERNWNYPKISAPSLKGKDASAFFYFSYNTGVQNQYPIYRTPADKLDAYRQMDGPPGELFFDPNLLSEDGTISLAQSSFTESGKLWAYGLSKSGSDWSTVYVRSTEAPFKGVEDASKLDDVVQFVKFSSVTWTHDEKGFFYQRFPTTAGPGGDLGTATASDKDAAIYYHRLGTDQAEDELVHKDETNPEWMFGVGVTTDGQWALLSSSKDTAPSALLSVARLEEGVPYSQLKWKSIVSEWGAAYSYMGNDNSTFWFQTNKDAPNEKVVVVDVAAEKPEFKELIAEDPDAVLESAQLIRDDLMLLAYSQDVNDQLYLHELATGKRIRRFLPDFVGSLGVSGRRAHSRFFVSVTSYLSPGSVYECDFAKTKPDEGELTLIRETKMDLKPSDFISEQVFYTSKDGTRIPMTITRRADQELDGTAPALLYGYGGFKISLSARFSPSWMTWVKTFGGVLAVPALRGGGEYGEKWHKAGILDNKHNTFDDYIAAAEYLVEHKYTSAGKIIVNGGSNGGLLAAAATQRAPEGLLGATVADVGVMDLLNFHRFGIGRYWASDYGNVDDPSDFDFMRPLSPLHNVAESPKHNPMLITTADHDDRVSPLHSFKLAAELQHKGQPALLRVEKKAGHGAGKPTSKIIDEAVDKWCWASHVVGATVKA